MAEILIMRAGSGLHHLSPVQEWSEARSLEGPPQGARELYSLPHFLVKVHFQVTARLLR